MNTKWTENVNFIRFHIFRLVFFLLPLSLGRSPSFDLIHSLKVRLFVRSRGRLHLVISTVTIRAGRLADGCCQLKLFQFFGIGSLALWGENFQHFHFLLEHTMHSIIETVVFGKWCGVYRLLHKTIYILVSSLLFIVFVFHFFPFSFLSFSALHSFTYVKWYDKENLSCVVVAPSLAHSYSHFHFLFLVLSSRGI